MGSDLALVAAQLPNCRPSARWISVASRRSLWALLFALSLGTWGQSAKEPVTLTYFRLGWFQPDEPQEANAWERRFMQETGIQLRNLPVPETALDQLDLSKKLLQNRYGPDVLGLDLIWSGALAGDLLDSRSYFGSEISAIDPRLLPSYIVDGGVVAIPNAVQIGVLEYRAELLLEDGYDHPPRTWSELEKMAQRIQVGERAKGKKDFWGYVWQGAAAEALTCNALEWQASEGGGRIIEDDRTISVNNRATIRAVDPALLPTLQAIEITLPTQLEAIAGLAQTGDWEAVRLRLGNELKPLETQTSVLVD